MFRLTFTACAWLAIAFAANSEDSTIVSAPTTDQDTNTTNASNQENHQQANGTETEPDVQTAFTFSAYDPRRYQNPNCRAEIYQRVWLTGFADVVPLTASVSHLIEFWVAFFALPVEQRPNDVRSHIPYVILQPEECPVIPAPLAGPPDHQRGYPDTNVVEPVVAADTRGGRAYTPTKDETYGANQENQQQTTETGPQDRRLGNPFDPRLLRNPTSKYERMLRLYLTGNAEVIPLTDEELIGVNEKAQKAQK